MLVGQYLRLAEGGDIRRRDTMRLAEAEREYQVDANAAVRSYVQGDGVRAVGTGRVGLKVTIDRGRLGPCCSLWPATSVALGGCNHFSSGVQSHQRLG